MGGAIGPPRVTVAAPAKVNPWLEVLGRRADGFHELDTHMLALDLADEVTVEAREDAPAARADGRGAVLALEVHALAPGAADGCPADARNLAWRAAESAAELAAERGTSSRGLALRLGKRIPSEAGLGGGSSDAAAAALGAAMVLGLDVDDPAIESDLAERLAALGSDCAFFLRARAAGAARCTGRGEHVEPCTLPSSAPVVALVTPDARASTPEVYAHLSLDTAHAPRATPALAEILRADVRAFCRLEQAAPPLQRGFDGERWRAVLDEAADAARARRRPDDGRAWGDFCLSGSGSSFFAFAANRTEAERLLDDVRVRAKARDLGLRHESVVAPARTGVIVLDRK